MQIYVPFLSKLNSIAQNIGYNLLQPIRVRIYLSWYVLINFNLNLQILRVYLMYQRIGELGDQLSDVKSLVYELKRVRPYLGQIYDVFDPVLHVFDTRLLDTRLSF